MKLTDLQRRAEALGLRLCHRHEPDDHYLLILGRIDGDDFGIGTKTLAAMDRTLLGIEQGNSNLCRVIEKWRKAAAH